MKGYPCVGIMATYLDVNKLINYICDKSIVKIQMRHKEIGRCKIIKK